MIRRLCFLCFLLVVSVAGQAQEDSKAKMNAVKQQSAEYYFGESTAANRDEATQSALFRLMEHMATENVVRTEEQLKDKVECIYIPRGSSTRAFVYVKKALVQQTAPVATRPASQSVSQPAAPSVSQSVSPSAPPSASQTVSPAASRPSAPLAEEQPPVTGGISSVLQTLSQCQQVTDAFRCLKNFQQFGTVSACGPVTRREQLTEDVYLIVYDDARTIRVILSPEKNGVRSNAVTGVADNLKNYSGCGVIWFK